MFNYKENYNKWLEDNFFDEETREELSNITDEKEIEDRFYRDLEFGTGGLRGVMGAGTNRMNKYTIGKATKGLGMYLLDHYGVEACAKRGVVIGYDTRNNSKDFSEITANVLTGMGIKVYLHSEARPTPQLSFSVKFLNALAGVVITASHNPKEYNGYKVYILDITNAIAIIYIIYIKKTQKILKSINAMNLLKLLLILCVVLLIGIIINAVNPLLVVWGIRNNFRFFAFFFVCIVILDSYRKIDNYFEEAVRSKHANDSAAEIRKRSELNYLDTSMRELVAEVSEAHGADERDIYGIKSVASKQLISIKFDKILLRLADLLDMSSYRVSKPILYHNVEQMSEESAFHWISHLLTKGYSLRTEYEITDNAHVLAPKNIIEKLVLEIPVNISQMSALTCGRTCKKVGIDRNRLSQQGIVLVCGQECKDNGNQERNCNFLCKWFCVKNENLIKELAALKEYLNRNKNNYFKSAIEIRIKCNDRTSLDARQFEILNEYIGKM